MATKSAGDGGGGRRSRVIYTENKTERSSMRLENPFTFKVGQVFTGFGIGCGVGIGVGRPLHLGAIPVLGQVMTAARGATDAFSGVQRHVNNSLKKVGAKNIQAGIGCGVGFGHGFGVGLALKPSVLHQIQSQFTQVVTSMMGRLGIDSSSSLSVNQGMIPPASLESGKSRIDESSYENQSITHLVKSAPNNRNGAAIMSSEGTSALTSASINTEYTSRTEKVLNNFLKDLKDEGSSLHELAGTPQLENNLLQMVLKHQVLIKELMQENEKLRQILFDELKVQSSATSRKYAYSSRATTKCDVYSFGVVLLELVTGKKPVEAEFGENKNITYWASTKAETKEGIDDVLDQRVMGLYEDDMIKVLTIALRCTCGPPLLRPTMNDVVQHLIEADPCKFNCCNFSKEAKETANPTKPTHQFDQY